MTLGIMYECKTNGATHVAIIISMAFVRSQCNVYTHTHVVINKIRSRQHDLRSFVFQDKLYFLDIISALIPRRLNIRIYVRIWNAIAIS